MKSKNTKTGKFGNDETIQEMILNSIRIPQEIVDDPMGYLGHLFTESQVKFILSMNKNDWKTIEKGYKNYFIKQLKNIKDFYLLKSIKEEITNAPNNYTLNIIEDIIEENFKKQLKHYDKNFTSNDEDYDWFIPVRFIEDTEQTLEEFTFDKTELDVLLSLSKSEWMEIDKLARLNDDIDFYSENYDVYDVSVHILIVIIMDRFETRYDVLSN